MGLSYAEENYLKAILKLSGSPDGTVSTNAIAAQLDTSAASVTDMLKKLSGQRARPGGVPGAVAGNDLG